MQREKRVKIEELEREMTLSRDIELDGHLLLAQGTQLSSRLIQHLLYTNIDVVWVFEDVHGSQTVLKPAINRQQVYSDTFYQNTQKFENIVGSFQKGQPIQQDDLKEIIQNYLDIPSKYQLLKFSNGIREVDQYTYQHSMHVCSLAILLGQWLGFPNITELAQAALLHDIGKININPKVLNKPGKLTDQEWEHMKLHPVYGYAYLREHSDLSREVLQGVLFHHESMDGTGYPKQLKGDEIPDIAKIISIVDVFDALTSDRVYRKKMNIVDALYYLSTQYQKFEPHFLSVFVDHMTECLIGERVRLNNGKVGKIVFRSPIDSFRLLVQLDDQFIDLAEQTEIKVAEVI